MKSNEEISQSGSTTNTAASAETAAQAAPMRAAKGEAWHQLIAACLLVGGIQGFIFNIIGIYIQPVTAELGLSTALFGSCISIGAIGQLIMFGMAGRILKKFKLRRLLIVLIVLGGVFYIIMGFNKSLVGFMVLFFFCYACMSIPGYVTGPMLVGQWFQKKKGTAMGIMMLCGSLCAVVGNLLGGTLLGARGYSGTFPIIGFIALVISLIGACMAVISPRAVGLKPYGWEPGSDEKSQGKATADAEEIGIPAGKAIKSLPFILLFICMMFMVAAGSFTTLTSAHAVNIGYTIEEGTRFAACMTVGALFGSLLIGMINDKFSAKVITVAIFTGIAIGALLIIFIWNSSTIALAAACVFFGFFTAGSGVQLALLVGKVFGQKDYASILAKLQMSLTLGGMIAVPVFGAVFDATGSYLSALVLIIILAILGILITIAVFAAAKRLWRKAINMEMPK